MEESSLYIFTSVSVLMWFFTAGLCFRYKDKKRRGLMMACLVLTLLLFGLMIYIMSTSPTLKKDRDNVAYWTRVIVYCDYVIYLVVMVCSVIWYYQGLDGSYLWSTWLKDRKMFRARKNWIRAVEEFGRIESVSRHTIKLNGMDYGEYFRIRYGLAKDDPYFLKHNHKLKTGYDRRLQAAQEYEELCRITSKTSDYDYSSSSHGSKKYRPDEWRKDIPYSDPFDSHLSATAPDRLDRDGDGYIDGTVGDGGYEA